MEQVKKLCKLAQQGDRDAACKLVETFYKQIYSYLYRLSGSSKDAEDLTQETFALLENSDTLEIVITEKQ